VDNIATYVDDLDSPSGGKHDNLTLAIVETKINSKLKPKMSKKMKISISILTILLVASVIVNIVQWQHHNNCGTCTDSVTKDSVASATTPILKDSVEAERLQLLNLTEKIPEKIL